MSRPTNIEQGGGPMPEFFEGVPKIQFGGPRSRSPLEFKHYNPDEMVGGKSMKDHLRFSVVYWHTIANPLGDPLGAGTAIRPWDEGTEGRARGVLDPLEHRHQARGGSPRPVPPHGGRLQEPDRIRRAVLHRAQADGADQAPVRLRRRGLPQLPPDLRPPPPLQAQPGDEPRDAGGTRDDARDARGH